MGAFSTAAKRPGTYVGHARELLAIARCAALYPLGVAERMLSTGNPCGDPARDVPVLLVHGYGHNRSGWFSLDRALRLAGFTSVHTMNYVAAQGVPELAAQLAGRVAQVKALTGAERIHVIGHSLGGVILRWYVQELGGDEHVRTAITVASPHEGTVTAIPAVGAAARDLRPGSRVMRRLAAGSRHTAVRWVAFYTNLDLLVQPATSAMLRHPDLDATNIFVKDHGHIRLMTSPEVAESVVDQLLAGTPGTASVTPLRRSATAEAGDAETGAETGAAANPGAEAGSATAGF